MKLEFRTSQVRLAIVAAFSFGITSEAAQAQSMVDIGALGEQEYSYSIPYGISSDGLVVVGGSETSSWDYRAYKYVGGVMSDLGTLGGNDSEARGISADGQIIVGFSEIADGSDRAFLHTSSGGMVSLGTLGEKSYANAISANGEVIIGRYVSNNANKAFRYTPSLGMQSLDTFGGTESNALAVSANGEVITGFARLLNGNAPRAFRYTVSGGMENLGVLAGGNSSFASAISADGAVIVGRSTIDFFGTLRAFMHTDSNGMQSLGTLGGSSRAEAVSADGGVIVGMSMLLNGDNRAFRYTTSGGMENLGTLGGNFSYATQVSADGRIIAGDSTIESGSFRAFRYTASSGMQSLGTLGGDFSEVWAISANGLVIVGTSETEIEGEYRAYIYSTASDAPMVDVQNTYAALSSQGYQLNSILNAQNTLLGISLNYDCTVYGVNNICVGVGGRYAAVNNPSSSQTAGNIQIGYRPHPSVRVGVFLDQGISNATPNNYTVNNSQPMAGFFAVYAPRGDHLGPQIKVSAAYGNSNVNISRNVLANTEAGQGSSSITAQGAQLESAYGMLINERWTASPLVGIKSTQVSRTAYAETAGAAFPISYSTVNQSATTVYTGAKLSGYIAPKVSIGVNAGVEQDLNSNIDSFSGSIYFLGSFNQAAPTIQKTRAFAGTNANYWIEKNQRVSLGIFYNQQSLNSANGVTGLLSYTIGI